MTKRTLATALMLALPLSSLLVACGGNEDSADRAAIEREALERDLNLTLQAEPAAQPQLADVPVAADSAPAGVPAFTPPPAPAPRRVPPAPRREQPRLSERPRVETPSAPAEPRYVTRTAGAGQTFAVRIDEEISARQDGAGSTFTATLTDALTDAQGNTVIPAGATVRGQVASVEGGEIALDFTSISYGGERYSISSSVLTPPAARRVNRTSGGETAAKVAGGGAVGAVLGRVIGRDRRSAIAGAAIGAAAGTGVAIATANVDRVIDAGSTATVRLDTPVTVQKEL
ncbi:MAG TPA: hypothetical protein VEW03_02175 [Longimicrobiaceae bacterium]|nr:hypothetical protein [Longimicrobiaceae bacterium]